MKTPLPRAAGNMPQLPDSNPIPTTGMPVSDNIAENELNSSRMPGIRSLYFLLLTLSALVITFAAHAFPPRLDGTMMPYDFSQSDTVVPWGDDMEPVFINYVARHGARFLSSEKKVDELLKTLRKAESEGLLTRKGKDFLTLVERVDSVTGGEWGALNAIGIMEEKRLGNEMAATAPALLQSGRVEAIATYVPRVVMTMYELCHQLAIHSSHLEIYTSEGRQFSTLLRYFTTDKPYVEYLASGPWKFAFDNFSRNTLPVNPAASMMEGVTDSNRLQKLSLDAYGVLQSLRAAGIDAQPDEWFSGEEYRKCWEVENLRHYYQRSASSFSDLPARCAAPILQDIILKTDQALKGGDNLKAFLRFGHAETVIPLFALMRLPGCYAPLCNPEDVSASWKDYEVAPLGANLMVVCLKDSGGTAYASVRLNGRWIAIDGKKVIEWTRLRDLWQSYINA